MRESDVGKRLQGRLEGVSVVLHYAINPAHRHRQGQAHLRWWSRLFYRLGAAAVFEGERLMPKVANDCMGRAPRKGVARQSKR